MQASLSLSRDAISPALKLAIQLTGRARPVLQAAGNKFKELTQSAFFDAAVRPEPWAPGRKTDGRTLIRKGTLARSFKVTASDTETTVTTDRHYAAIHQFGGIIRKKGKGALKIPIGGGKFLFRKKVTIPARPFFPVRRDGRLTPRAATAIGRTIQAKLDAMLGK
jgi:phage gpG-like protein